MLNFKEFRERQEQKKLPLREQFFRGLIFNVGDIVEGTSRQTGESVVFEILGRGTNYVTTVTESGGLSKWFIDDLRIVEDATIPTHSTDANFSFKGYKPGPVFQANEQAVAAFKQTAEKYDSGIIKDGIAIVRAIKAVDAFLSMAHDSIVNQKEVDKELMQKHLSDASDILSKIGEFMHHEDYLHVIADAAVVAKSKQGTIEEMNNTDKIKVATVIADTLGADSNGSNPELMVNNALRTAKKNPNMVRGESMKIISRMLDLAREVGIKFDETIIKESLDEAIVSGNKGYGYHGQHESDVADKKFSAMHSQLKKKFGEEGHLRDVKKPNVMVKHFLDSTHGRHLVGAKDDEISSRFKSFKRTYNPQLFESEYIDEAIVSGNKGYGYHGEHPSEVADKKFSAMHSKVKRMVGEAGHLRDVKAPNVIVKHFLDSAHGRHIAHEGDSSVLSRFKSFKRTYNPELHEGNTATYVKTPLTQQGNQITIHKDEASFLKKAKELHGDGITSKNHSDNNTNDRKTYRNKEGKLIGYGAGDYDNKNWTWKLHSKHINESSELDESVIRIQHTDRNGNIHILSSSSKGFVALNKGTSSLANVMHSAPGHNSSGTKEKSDALNKAIKSAHAGGKDSVLAAAKKATGLNWTHHSVNESSELEENYYAPGKTWNDDDYYVVDRESKKVLKNVGKVKVPFMTNPNEHPNIKSHLTKPTHTALKGMNARNAGYKLEESEELDELNINTLKSYSDKAKQSATKLTAQGAKTKNLDTAYSKMKKASTRLSGAAKADKKVFGKEWNKRIGLGEEAEEIVESYKVGDSVSVSHHSGRTIQGKVKGIHGSVVEVSHRNGKIGFYHNHKLQLNEENSVDDEMPLTYDELVQRHMTLGKPVVSTEGEHRKEGHSLNPSNETHRKQMVHKLKD